MADNTSVGTATTVAAPQTQAESTPAPAAASAAPAANSEAFTRAAYDAAKQGKTIERGTIPAPSDTKEPESDTKEPESETEAPSGATSTPGTGTPTRGPDGKFLPRTVPAPGAPAASADGKGKPAKADALPAILDVQQRADLVIARRTLQRDGWTDADLASVPPERLLQIAGKRQREQAEMDISIRRRQVDTRNLQDPNARGGRQQTDNGVHSSRPSAPGHSPDPEIDRILAELDGEGAPDRGQADPDAQRQPTAEPSRATQLFAELTHERTTFALEKVASDFPQIKDQRIADAVRNMMGYLDPSAEAARTSTEAVSQLAREACETLFATEIKEQARAQRVASNRAARLGSPDVDSQPGEGPARKATPEEFSRAAFEASKIGGTPQEVIRRRDQILSGGTVRQ